MGIGYVLWGDGTKYKYKMECEHPFQDLQIDAWA